MNTVLSVVSKFFEQILLDFLKFVLVALLVISALFTGAYAQVARESFRLPDVGGPTPEPPFPDAVLETLIIVEEESSAELEKGYDRNEPLLF